MLARLDDLAYQMSELGTAVPEQMIPQSVLEGFPEKYRLQKRMLTGVTLERRMWSRVFRVDTSH